MQSGQIDLRKDIYTIFLIEKYPPELLNFFVHHIPPGFKLVVLEEGTQEEENKKMAEADFIVLTSHRLSAQTIANGRNVRLIQKLGVGTDMIDLKAAATSGIPVANTGEASSISVAEHTILLMLAVYKKLLLAYNNLKFGRWTRFELRLDSFELFDKKLGIIGLGRIGQEVAKRAKAFGMDINYYDIRRPSPDVEQNLGANYLSLPELLATCDVISLHVRLTEGSKPLIGKDEFKLMKRTGIIINTARAELIESEDILIHALKEKEIAGAGLDVFHREPITKDNPLLHLENVVATPHIGAGTKDSLSRVYREALNNILRVANGLMPENVLNPNYRFVKV